MIKTRGIDFKDAHKMVAISTHFSSLSDGSLTPCGVFRVPFGGKATLVGIEVNVRSAANADNTLQVQVLNAASAVIADTGSLSLSSAPISNITPATGVSNVPPSDSQMDSATSVVSPGDLLTFQDAVSGTSPQANDVEVILFFY